MYLHKMMTMAPTCIGVLSNDKQTSRRRVIKKCTATAQRRPEKQTEDTYHQWPIIDPRTIRSSRVVRTFIPVTNIEAAGDHCAQFIG